MHKEEFFVHKKAKMCHFFFAKAHRVIIFAHVGGKCAKKE